MSNKNQSDVARDFWQQTNRGKIGPVDLYVRQKQLLSDYVLPLIFAGDSVLDIGCADGEFTLLYAQVAKQVVGIDISAKLIDQAQTKVRSEGIQNVEFQVRDVFEFESAERFQVVSLMGVLTTIKDNLSAERVVLKASSLLVPGGWLILKDSVMLTGTESKLLKNATYEAIYRPQFEYIHLVRSLGFDLFAEFPILTMENCGQTRVLYIFRQTSVMPFHEKIKGMRVACYGNMPFHFRSLKPLSECFEESLLTLSIDEVMEWSPDVIAVADGWSVEFWRDYCDAYNVELIAMRHGSVTRYGYAESQYNFADFMCGSVWDIEDTLLSKIHPRRGFLLTGNAWVDQVFKLPKRELNQQNLTILFAPTYNPEISAAVFFGDRLVPIIRQVFPNSRIVIKPHPAIVQNDHAFVAYKNLFKGLMDDWHAWTQKDPLVELIDAPEASIADSFAEADILVADASSLIFEFMTLDRPILLYSSDIPVQHWAYNPNAPGNSWRDVGLEFSDDKGFIKLLKNPFEIHKESCSLAQRKRAQQLYGFYQDGLSTERVAAAIAHLSKFHIVINALDIKDADAAHILDLAKSFRAVLSLSTISVIGSFGLSGATVTEYSSCESWRDVFLREFEDTSDYLLLVDGRTTYTPGSAHQINSFIGKLQSGALKCAVLVNKEDDQLSIDVTGALENDWLLKRLVNSISSFHEVPAWVMLSGPAFLGELKQLPELISKTVFDIWWRTLSIKQGASMWPANDLNLVYGKGVIKDVGRQRYILCQSASFNMVPAVRGLPSTKSVFISLSKIPNADYDLYPFEVVINVNGDIFVSLVINGGTTRTLEIPYQPDKDGNQLVVINCTGATAGLRGISGPISLYAKIDVNPVTVSQSDQPQIGSHTAVLVKNSRPSAAITKSTLNSYENWRVKKTLTEADLIIHNHRLDTFWQIYPVVHVIIELNVGDEQLLANTIDSLSQQLYSDWRLVILAPFSAPDNSFDEIDIVSWVVLNSVVTRDSVIRSLLSEDERNWLWLVPVGVQFEPQAFLVLGDYISTNLQACLFYVDDDELADGGALKNPRFKPDFNRDYLYSYDYLGACAVSSRALKSLETWLLSSQALDYHWALQLMEVFGEAAIAHIPEVLLHYPQRTISASHDTSVKVALEQHLHRTHRNAEVQEGYVPGTYNIVYQWSDQPLVSIIVPTRDRLDILQPCIASLLAKTSYAQYEVLIVDNQSELPETLTYFKTIQEQYPDTVRVLSYPKAYNYSAINNYAAELALGEYLVLLNNDTIMVHENWLERMLNHCQHEEVGIVGARLVFPNQTLQHAGVILGMGSFGVADHPHISLPMTDPGYMNRAQVVQNFSAVTAACLLIPKSLYFEVGGLDEENFKVLFNDVDLCLKVRERGYKIVWTPYATVVHHGSSSIKADKNPDKAKRARQEADKMLEKWLPQLANDPAYNRNLSLKHRHFQIETETDVTWNVDFHDRLRIYAFPANDSGVGEYRVRSPLRALTNAAMIQSSLLPNHSATLIPDIVEIERVKPDLLLLQNGTADYLIHAWEQYKRFNSVFRIYSQDDLVFALPGKHPLQGKWPKDMRKRLRKLMENSDRLIVANEPLKEAYSRWIDDIKIVPNYLESTRWLNLSVTNRQRTGNKLRVGWAGGAQHHGDLEFIIPVVESLKNEVDWIFMGMCPDRLKPIIKEYHGGVSFDLYPQKLAELDLDLAIAPLEYNNFNTAKTNLRILEYGVLGWPVICSDILPYQNAPVTLVGNNTQYWLKAIREKIGEPEALTAEGNALQQWVLDNYLLEDHLDDWLMALTP
ncbi:methyltransferase domain-containing protein [Methylicorpusculum oleiharenae]|uniref:glycosyltransferase n=1 Tax=Methylicorpusculum oleiharenae TaxID=1338687 RepID=UPI001356C44A|nr:glycosyltransferase [Methylicorpusculum oleiharenae]MCD2449099.1 methyltransferase domain-containing protein [Methylicorpusculum oleiharenae]